MIILSWLVSALSLIIVSEVVPGFEVASFFSALVAALILGLVNATIKPFLLVVSLPATMLTLGLFSFVINALMLMLVSAIVKGFNIVDFRAALLGAIILTLINWAANAFQRSYSKASQV